MLEWEGRIFGLLHQNDITQKQLAEEMQVTKEYVCMLLNGKIKVPDGMEQRMVDAIESIKTKRE